MTSVAAVVLAAGAGRRMGGVAKAVLRTPDDRSFLEAIAGLCRRVGGTELVVVIAEPHRLVTRAEADRLGVPVVVNDHPEDGMASSVEAGFGHAVDAFRAPAALLWPVDHAYVGLGTVETLIREAAPDRIVIPEHGGRGGHPTLFGRDVWPELAACAGAPEGARSVVRANPSRISRVRVDDRGVVGDVDTRDDLQ